MSVVLLSLSTASLDIPQCVYFENSMAIVYIFRWCVAQIVHNFYETALLCSVGLLGLAEFK